MSKKNARNKATHTEQKTTKNSQQVRIIGGKYKRRNLSFISSEGLRPTPDRVRETVFNWLMHDLFGATVLDACAGSGVLGFEALSRGAHHVTFIEANKSQYRQLLASKKNLDVSDDDINIIHAKAEQEMERLQNTNHTPPLVYDLVFLDPPYSLNLWLPILSELIKNRLISNQSNIYIEADQPIENILADFSLISNYEVIKSKKMGTIHIAIICLEIKQPI